MKVTQADLANVVRLEIIPLCFGLSDMKWTCRSPDQRHRPDANMQA